MNCRKILLIVLAAVSFTLAQTNETLNIFTSLGFGFPTGGLTFSSHTFDNQILSEREDKYFNYGQGIKLDAGVQYFMMENVALQAAFGYSGKIPGLETRNVRTLAGATVTDSSIEYKAQLFGIKALVVPRFEILELLNMYTGVGIGFFWNSLSYEAVYETVTVTGTDVDNREGKIKSTPALGLLGLIGIDIPLSDLTAVFGEVAFEQMSFTWKKRIEEKGYTAVYEKDATNLEAPPKVPGSNWQIRFGIRFIVL
ncbi:MAG: hypothetical protein GX556_09060 [Fibrobacter sp.]|nr:hypothetical protein [Fibrobacter sp.]